MIKIIKNFLEPELLTKIKQRVFSQDFPWYWRDKMVNEDHYWFNHTFYRYGKILSPHFEDWIKPILNKLKATKVLDARCNMNTREKELNLIQPKAIIRIKGNLYPSTPTLEVHQPHKDYKYKHQGAIFYMNTCNGYTLLEDDTKIDTVANRLLLFDSSTPHSSTSTTDQKARININFNFFK
jgi:hypothetical protein